MLRVDALEDDDILQRCFEGPRFLEIQSCIWKQNPPFHEVKSVPLTSSQNSFCTVFRNVYFKMMHFLGARKIKYDWQHVVPIQYSTKITTPQFIFTYIYTMGCSQLDRPHPHILVALPLPGALAAP